MQQYKALNLRQPQGLRLALADAYANDKILLGAAMGIPSVEVAKVIAKTHPDWVWLDAEHSPYSLTLLADLVRVFFIFLFLGGGDGEFTCLGF